MANDIPATMTAIEITEPGGPEVLQTASRAVPTPEPGEVLIKVAAAGFVIPFMAVYTPALMLQDGGPLAAEIGYLPAVAYIVFKTALAIGLWGAAVIGYLGRPLGWPMRALGMVAAFTLIAALPLTDEIGFALVALFVGLVYWQTRKTEKVA